MKIKSVKRKQFKGLAYNLTLEAEGGDANYIVQEVAVSNCVFLDG